jgi:hypothetical protein
MADTPAPKTTTGRRIYEDAGEFVISDCGTWLPGVYATRRAAEQAFDLPVEVLDAMQVAANAKGSVDGGAITEEDIANGWPVPTDVDPFHAGYAVGASDAAGIVAKWLVDFGVLHPNFIAALRDIEFAIRRLPNARAAPDNRALICQDKN